MPMSEGIIGPHYHPAKQGGDDRRLDDGERLVRSFFHNTNSSW